MPATARIIHICQLCCRAKGIIAMKDKKTGKTSWYCSVCWDSYQSTLVWENV